MERVGVMQSGEQLALERHMTEAAENEAKVAAGKWNDYLFDRLITRKVYSFFLPFI